MWYGWVNPESGRYVKTKEILSGSRGDDVTDTPSHLPLVTNGQQQQHLLPQALEPNTEGIDGEQERRCM